MTATPSALAAMLLLLLAGCVGPTERAMQLVPVCPDDGFAHYEVEIEGGGYNATYIDHYRNVFQQRGWSNITVRAHTEGTGGVFGGSKNQRFMSADCEALL